MVSISFMLDHFQLQLPIAGLILELIILIALLQQFIILYQQLIQVLLQLVLASNEVEWPGLK
tara:strand:- start:224 stop:409 length:186 start_codon:yes stop_codon:yes gene_type:complete